MVNQFPDCQPSSTLNFHSLARRATNFFFVSLSVRMQTFYGPMGQCGRPPHVLCRHYHYSLLAVQPFWPSGSVTLSLLRYTTICFIGHTLLSSITPPVLSI